MAKKEMVIRDSCLIAGGLKLAAYRVWDEEMQEYSQLQFHAVYGNTVLAVMGKESARLFSNFVTNTLKDES